MIRLASDYPQEFINYIEETFGRHRLSYITDDDNNKFGFFYLSEEEISSLSMKYPDIILDYSPLIPNLKISSELSNISPSSNENPKSFASPSSSTSPFLNCNGINIQENYNGVAPEHVDYIATLTFASEDHYNQFKQDFLQFTNELNKNYQNSIHSLASTSTTPSAPVHFSHFDEEFLGVKSLKENEKIAINFNLDKFIDNKHNVILRVNSYTCSSIPETVNWLSNRLEVAWIEQLFPFVSHNRWAKGISTVGQSYKTFNGSDNFLGDGEVVGVGDTGLDINSCFFHDDSVEFQFQTSFTTLVTNPDHRKVIQYVAFRDKYESEGSHGTHVCGTVAGITTHNYGDYARFSGHVPNAKIAFFDASYSDLGNDGIETPNDLFTNYFLVMYSAGARIITNSWGSSGVNTYTTSCVAVDRFMRDYPDVLILFSVGNDGENGYNTVSSPSTNKNGLSVGASLNSHDSWKAARSSSINSVYSEASVADFSSKGPTSDRRMKPDVLLPGYYVHSSRGYKSTSEHCELKSLSGTSMATPAAAALAVKVRQYFLKGYYPSGSPNTEDAFTPSGALLKAMLIHSTSPIYTIANEEGYRDIIGDYPTREAGYGRVQLDRVLNFGSSSTDPLSLFVIGDVDSSSSNYAQLTTNSETIYYSFKVNKKVPVRVTLTYSDYPGTSGSNSPLVNKLSLRVIDPYNNYIQPYSHSNAILSTAQVIDIPSPDVNKIYTVAVAATTIAQGPQPFALVVTGEITKAEVVDGLYEVSEVDANSSIMSYYTSKYDTNNNNIIYIIILGIVALLMTILSCVFRCAARKKIKEINKSVSHTSK